MSTRLKILLLIAITAMATLWVILTGSGPEESIRQSASTYSSSPRGCKALLLLLDELKVPATRLRKRLYRLTGQGGVLIIVGPQLVKLTKREATRVEEWVKAGNRVVIFDGPPSREVSLGTGEESEEGSPSIRLHAEPLHSPSLALDLLMRHTSDNSRKTVIAPLPGMDSWAKVSVSNRSRWQGEPANWETILDDTAGPIVMIKKLGSGQIMAVSDSTLPSNGQLGKQQNLRIVLALILAGGHPREILFDEFHHGHTIAENVWSYFGSSVLSLMLTQVGIGVVLLFYSKRARHSGRFRSLDPPKRRASLEYVDSMANIFEAGRAWGLALEAILIRFLGGLSRKAGMPLKNLDDDSLSRILAWAPQGSDQMATLVRKCREAASSSKDPDLALELAKDLTHAARKLSAKRGGGHA